MILVESLRATGVPLGGVSGGREHVRGDPERLQLRSRRSGRLTVTGRSRRRTLRVPEPKAQALGQGPRQQLGECPKCASLAAWQARPGHVQRSANRSRARFVKHDMQSAQ